MQFTLTHCRNTINIYHQLSANDKFSESISYDFFQQHHSINGKNKGDNSKCSWTVAYRDNFLVPTSLVQGC